MKRIITLFTFCFCAAMVMAQTPALKVAMDGNVGINQATPLQLLHLTKDAALAGFIVERTDGGATSNFVSVAAGQTGSGFIYKEDRIFLVIPGATTTSNAVDPLTSFAVQGPNANVGVGTFAPSTKMEVNGVITHGGLMLSSDRKTKSNVTKFGKGLEAVMNIQPIEYEYNGKGGTIAGAKHIGIIAQDLQREVPQLVAEFEHSNIESATLDGEYKVSSTEQILRVKDNEIKYVLWNAIRDQQEIIEEKDEQIKELLSRVESIESKLNGLLDNSNNEVIGTLDKTGGFLGQNVPNPFTDQTTIDYEIPQNATSAAINVIDMSGKVIRTFSIDHTGKGALKLSADDNVTGTYSYQLVVDGKMLDIRTRNKFNKAGDLIQIPCFIIVRYGWSY